MLSRLVPALVAVVLVAGCGEKTGDPSASTPAPRAVERPAAVPAAPGEVTTSYPITVLDDGGGAELCLGGVMQSLPPQCGGPPLVGWEWSEHEGDYEDVSGVRWGDFKITGTFDGTSITPSEVLPVDQVNEPSGRIDEDQFKTPCPEPAGGWKPTDPAKVSMDDFNTVMQVASQLDGYAGTWVDQSINPMYGHADTSSLADMGKLNDPALEVLNVTVTHGTEAAEQQLRAVYGGPLCVTRVEHSAQELQDIAGEMDGLPGILSWGGGMQSVEVEVLYDDGSYQRWADATYGEGLVVVGSALQDVG